MNENQGFQAHRTLTRGDEFYNDGVLVAFLGWADKYPTSRFGSLYRKAHLVTRNGVEFTLALNMAGSHPTY
mgnify:CR=1 FL=1